MSNNIELNMTGPNVASNFQPTTPGIGWLDGAVHHDSNDQAYQRPTQRGRQDPGYGPDEAYNGNLVATYQPSSSSSDWPITAGQELTSMLTPAYPNQASLLALKERLLSQAGGDAMLNKEEGAKALRISEQQMDLIIKNLGGADATSVSVEQVMEHFEEYANQDPLQLITDSGINAAIMDMMGGLGNFDVWAGEDDHINQNEFWGLAQALSDGLTVNDETFNIERPEANTIFGQLSGSDGLIDRNELAPIAEVQEDGTFDWEAAQQQLVERAAAVGQVGSGNNNGQSGSGSTGLPGAHPQPNNNWVYIDPDSTFDNTGGDDP